MVVFTVKLWKSQIEHSIIYYYYNTFLFVTLWHENRVRAIFTELLSQWITLKCQRSCAGVTPHAWTFSTGRTENAVMTLRRWNHFPVPQNSGRLFILLLSRDKLSRYGLFICSNNVEMYAFPRCAVRAWNPQDEKSFPKAWLSGERIKWRRCWMVIERTSRGVNAGSVIQMKVLFTKAFFRTTAWMKPKRHPQRRKTVAIDTSLKKHRCYRHGLHLEFMVCEWYQEQTCHGFVLRVGSTYSAVFNIFVELTRFIVMCRFNFF